MLLDVSEKEKAVKEVEQTMTVTANTLENSVKELKAQLTTAEERLEEIRTENQTCTEKHNLLKEELEQRCDDRTASLTSEIGALENMNLALNEQFKTMQSEKEELCKRNGELESDCAVVREKYETELQEKANLVQELENSKGEAAVTIAQLESSSHLVQEQIQTLNASLQDANVSLSDMKLEHDRLLKETENNITKTSDEKLRAAETWKSAHLEECSKALDERNGEIVKLQEKLEKFKSKVQVRLKEHEQIIAEKDKCLMRLQESFDSAAGAVKTSNCRVAELDDKVAEWVGHFEGLKSQLMETEGTVERLENAVDEGEGKLREEREAVAGARKKVEELEAEMVSQCERKKEELDAIEKQWQDKFAQLKQKYLAKLKEFQTQREGAEKTIQDRLELVEARNAEIEGKLLENAKSWDEGERNHREVMERLTGKEEEVKELNGKILELENLVTNIQGEQTEKVKLESAKMECRISEQQGAVSKMEAEMVEKETLIGSLREEKETLCSENKELVCAHEEENERLRGEFAARLKSAESVIEESIQKTESGQHTEVKLKVLVTNLKREKGELNGRISQLETVLEDEKKDREVDNRNSEMERDTDLGRMRDEYEARIQDTEGDHGSKVKQLLKTFNVKMTEKEKEFQDTYDTIMGR